MKTFEITCNDSVTNAGIAREWALCQYFGIDRQRHDHSDYRTSSDIMVGELNISVKASAFTLMSGSLCGGYTEFEDIWELYKRSTHSNTFAYVTADFTVYLMNLNEFEKFVHKFCRTETDSKKNGGKVKIRCKKETEEMRAWLRAAA